MWQVLVGLSMRLCPNTTLSRCRLALLSLLELPCWSSLLLRLQVLLLAYLHMLQVRLQSFQERR